MDDQLRAGLEARARGYGTVLIWDQSENRYVETEVTRLDGYRMPGPTQLRLKAGLDALADGCGWGVLRRSYWETHADDRPRALAFAMARCGLDDVVVRAGLGL